MSRTPSRTASPASWNHPSPNGMDGCRQSSTTLSRYKRVVMRPAMLLPKAVLKAAWRADPLRKALVLNPMGEKGQCSRTEEVSLYSYRAYSRRCHGGECADAQPVHPAAAPGPAKILPSMPSEAMTVTHWYKRPSMIRPTPKSARSIVAARLSHWSSAPAAS